jgi:hypothetical protein
MKMIVAALLALLTVGTAVSSAYARSCQQNGNWLCCATSSGRDECRSNPQ